MRTHLRSARPPLCLPRAAALLPALRALQSRRPGTRTRRAPGIRCPCLTVTSVAPEVSPVSPSAWAPPSPHPPLFFLKRKRGALREVILTPGGRVPMALAPHLIHFPSYRGHQQMPPVQRPLGPARFTSDLGTLQPGSCDVQGRVLQWPWGLPTQLRPSVPVSFLQLAPCPLPAELLESHTPGFCAVGLVRPVPRPAKCCSALPEHSERVFPSYFSSLCNSNSKLTKMALEQYFSTLFLTVAPPTPRSPFRHFPPNHPHHDILIPQMCLHIYYMHICALYTEKYTF